MRKLSIMFMIGVILAATTANVAAGANKSRSLEYVAESVADALAAGDEAVLNKHICPPEKAVNWLGKHKMTKDEYLVKVKEKKKIIDESWREVREAKLIIEKIIIQDVRIKKADTNDSGPPKVIAIAIPVIKIEGKPQSMPPMRMFFLPIDGEWKYIYQ